VALCLGPSQPLLWLGKAAVFGWVVLPALRRAHLPAAEVVGQEMLFHKSIFSCDVVFRLSDIGSWRYYAENQELAITAIGGFRQSWKTHEFTEASRGKMLAWLSERIPSGKVLTESSRELT
jgi:hypothetical protein